MRTMIKTRVHDDPDMEAMRIMRELAKIAFSSMTDFATFGSSGEIIKIDFDKAREIGAVVSNVTRKVGRGKKAKITRTTTITMPDKCRALIELGKRMGLFKKTMRRRNPQRQQ